MSVGKYSLSLLCGYDSMLVLLDDLWERDGKRSDDLAIMLGGMNRTVSGPPLDAAQWSDWLDATLFVRPDFESVRRAREQIQSDHTAFLKTLEIQDFETQCSAIRLLQEAASQRSWHVAGNEQMDLLQAYAAVVAFLRAYWKRRNSASNDIFQILQQFESGQPALWESWVSAVAEQSKIERDNSR
ncbi:MAG TPA: hypothetical protein VIJ85_02965 [Rhizomicrobium sp.]